MRFELNTIESWSEKTGFRPSALAKCAVLTDVLGEITLDPFLESRFAIRGEAAVHLLGASPVRLPQTLALHYVGDNTWKQFVADRGESLARINLIGKEFGLSIGLKDFQDRTTFSFYWQNNLRQEENVFVDINWAERTAINPTIRKVAWTPLGNGAFNALTLDPIEHAAYVAKDALGNVSAKAMQDLILLADRFGAEWASADMKKMFALVGSSLPKPLLSYSPNRLSFVGQREVDGGLLPAMKMGESVRTVGLISRAQTALSQLLAFSRDELSYLETLDLGHFEPEILFPRRKDLAEQLQKVPCFRFKGVGARKVLPPAHSEAEAVSS